MFQEGRVIVVADAATLDNVLSTIPRISFVSGFEIKILKRKGIRACKKTFASLWCALFIFLYILIFMCASFFVSPPFVSRSLSLSLS